MILHNICNFVALGNIYLCNVKWTPFILCMYIFCLAISPCTDGANDCKDKVEHHDHSEDHDDGCTPFCTCSCCGSLFAFSDVERDFNYSTVFSERIQSYSFHYFGSYLEEIWHPPTV